MRWIGVLALLAVAACAKRREEAAPPPEPRSTAPRMPVDDLVRSVIPVAPAPMPRIDAGAEPTPVPPSAVVSPTFAAYLHLLTIDVYFEAILDTYPGAPTGTRFTSRDYEWSRPDVETLDDMREGIQIAANHAREGATDAAGLAVIAYTDVSSKALPAVLDLMAYYTDDRYVDDEFARGRADGPLIQATRARLLRVRSAMWSAVLAAWRIEAGDVADSPRAVVGRAWEACLRVGQVAVTRGNAAVLDRAVSACRKGVPTVAALPASMHDTFDLVLRDTAVAVGDFATGSISTANFASKLLEVTEQYLERWPRIPGTPAERASP